MKVISSGKPLRKDVSAEVRRWLKESAEKKPQPRPQHELKRQNLSVSETPAAQ